MSATPDFDFSGHSIADAYADRLVPALFEPWARRLVAEHGPWQGVTAMDLATGTGAVARQLAQAVGPDGRVIAVDANADMLAVAARHCGELAGQVTLVQATADALDVEGDSIDVVVCQQGFQFFPDRDAASTEIRRVLRPGGRFVATSWLPVDRCQYFGAICEALEALALDDISQKMRVPFDHMPPGELTRRLETAGFSDIVEGLQEAPMVFEGGIDQAFRTARATPIAPDLKALPESSYNAFRSELTRRLADLADGSNTMGTMTTSLVTARKPG